MTTSTKVLAGVIVVSVCTAAVFCFCWQSEKADHQADREKFHASEVQWQSANAEEQARNQTLQSALLHQAHEQQQKVICDGGLVEEYRSDGTVVWHCAGQATVESNDATKPEVPPLTPPASANASVEPPPTPPGAGLNEFPLGIQGALPILRRGWLVGLDYQLEGIVPLSRGRTLLDLTPGAEAGMVSGSFEAYLTLHIGLRHSAP